MARKLSYSTCRHFSIILFFLLALVWPMSFLSPLQTVNVMAASDRSYKESNSHIEVNFPTRMLVGETEKLDLTIFLNDNFLTNEMDWDQFEPGEIHSAFLSFETKLELPDARIAVDPPNIKRVNMSPGHQQTFFFDVSAKEEGVFNGTLWVKMLLVPSQEMGKVYEKTIFAVPVEIKINSILGLSQKQAISISIIGIVLSLIILFFHLNKKAIG